MVGRRPSLRSRSCRKVRQAEGAILFETAKLNASGDWRILFETAKLNADWVDGGGGELTSQR
jgi:hypothetical protein